MCFFERLKKARLDAGYTQAQLASLIGVAKSTLTGYEKGNREPDVFKIKALAKALDVSADYLLGDDDLVDDTIKNETEKTPAVSGEGENMELSEIVGLVKRLPPEQWAEVKGYLKHLVYENEAVKAAKQINNAV